MSNGFPQRQKTFFFALLKYCHSLHALQTTHCLFLGCTGCAWYAHQPPMAADIGGSRGRRAPQAVCARQATETPRLIAGSRASIALHNV
eukprot:9366685-Pyramimonas_sp.AAC.1